MTAILADLQRSTTHRPRPAAAVWNPAIIEAETAPFGFHFARNEELTAAHAVAESIMGTTLSPLAVMERVHRRTKGTVLLHRERPQSGVAGASAARNSNGDGPTPAGLGGEISGVFLLLPLSAAGERDMRSGAFDTYNPKDHQICAPGEPFPAIYVWLYCGRGMRARLNVMRSCVAWRDGVYTNVRGYGRGASPEGAAAMLHLGFKSLPFGVPDLFVFDRQN